MEKKVGHGENLSGKVCLLSNVPFFLSGKVTKVTDVPEWATVNIIVLRQYSQ